MRCVGQNLLGLGSDTDLDVYIFELTGVASYKMADGRSLVKGDQILWPAVSAGALPSCFTNVGEGGRTSWPLCLTGGMGDKIYALPALYRYPGRLGIEDRDEPIYRLVKDKVRKYEGGDVNVLIDVGNDPRIELSDRVKEILRVKSLPGIDMPILRTSAHEKERLVKGKPDARYVVLSLWGTAPNRTWSEGMQLERLIKDRRVVIVQEKSCDLFPLIEGADCVITVNTSTLPMAGALFVPFVAVDAPARSGHFLEYLEVERDVDKVLDAYQSLMRRERHICWCGEWRGELSVHSNVLVRKCMLCGTERQEVKLSKRGVDKFYEKVYHRGWRSLIEGEKEEYQKRQVHDDEVSKLRISQWGKIPGRKWLDVGCANGCLTESLKEVGWDAEGMDLDELFAREVGAHWTWNEVRGVYDVISYVDVWEHAFPNSEMEKVKKHLREGGYLVIEVPVAQEEPKHYRWIQHLWFWTQETLSRMLRANGFTLVRTIRPFKGRLTVIAKLNER